MDLSKIYKFSKDLGRIDFSELVKSSSGFNIIPVDMNNLKHKTTIILLVKALNNFVVYSRKATRFTGNRVNDIGSALEETIRQEILKVGMNTEKLKGSGYPDLVIIHNDLTVYVEMKSSGIKNKEYCKSQIILLHFWKKDKR